MVNISLDLSLCFNINKTHEKCIKTQLIGDSPKVAVNEQL